MTPMQAALPLTEIATAAARTIPQIRTPLWRCSGVRPSSSPANTTTARCMMKAAAIPAVPPATSRPCSRLAERCGSHGHAWCMTPAATCAKGLSRPSDNPASSSGPTLRRVQRQEPIEACLTQPREADDVDTGAGRGSDDDRSRGPESPLRKLETQRSRRAAIDPQVRTAAPGHSGCALPARARPAGASRLTAPPAC